MLPGEPLADGLQVVARIEPLRDRADLLAQRLPVAQVGRAGEHVDLRAGIVDVVLAGHLVAGEVEQPGKRIAEHRAAAMAHMHRAGRVGRDVFHVDGRARALPAPAEAARCRRRRRAGPRAGPAASSRMLMKPGPAISTLVTRGSSWRSATRSSARARGFMRASLASTMAALVARSPWEGSRGGSTTTRLTSSPDGILPASASRPSASATRFSNSPKMFMVLYLDRAVRP